MILSSTSVMFMTWRIGIPDQLQKAAQDVYLKKCAEVADMPVVVNRGPAGIHAQLFAIHGDELINLS